MTRGERNANPGNIRISDIHWQGLTGNDGTFVTFDTPVDGIRALCKILINYQRVDGLHTISQMINRWAPPSDNNPTTEYAAFVASRVGIPVDQSFTLTPPTMLLMAKSIIMQENGGQPYDDLTISQAVTEAFA